jgi:hypothetical protein
LPPNSIKIILALAFALPSLALADATKDDVACAVAIRAEMAAAPKFRESGFSLYVFYMGRLSAEDDSIRWPPVIEGIVKNLGEKGRSATLLKTCTALFLSKTE